MDRKTNNNVDNICQYNIVYSEAYQRALVTTIPTAEPLQIIITVKEHEIHHHSKKFTKG